MIQISKPLITKADIKSVLNVLKSGNIAQGEKVKEFETKFAKYVGSKYAVAVSNGTAALQVVLSSLNFENESEIITTPFSFIASSNAILYAGLKPIFVDISPEDFNLNIKLIEAKITKKTKAVLVVHLFGQSADMTALLKLAKKHKLMVIEDACQAHGAKIGTKFVGNLGHAGCFSFYPTKNMTTGEGGIVTTNDEKLYKKMLLYRNHGQEIRYLHDVLGYNFRMTDMNGALGVSQLGSLEKNIAKRIKNATYLSKNLKNISGLITPFVGKNRRHVFNQYTIRLTKDFSISREEVIKKLVENQIGYGIYYPVIIPKQTLYKNLKLNSECPVAEQLSTEVLSLPIHPSVTTKELNKIVSVLKGIAKHAGKKI